MTTIAFEVTPRERWFQVEGSDGPRWFLASDKMAPARIEAYAGKVQNVQTVEGYGLRATIYGKNGDKVTPWLLCETMEQAKAIAEGFDPGKGCGVCPGCIEHARTEGGTDGAVAPEVFNEADWLRASGGYGAC